MTQAYFALFLEKGYLRDFRPEAGRFRTFLRASIAHFLANEWDRARTLKRGGGRAPLSLDAATAEERLRLEPVDRLTPEAAFERQWAAAVLARCLERLRREQEAAGGGDRFERLKAFLSSDGADAALRDARARAGPRRVDGARRGPPPAPALRRDPARRGPADRERPGRGRGRDPVPAGGGAREAAGGRDGRTRGEALPRVRGAAGRGVRRSRACARPACCRSRCAEGESEGAPAPPRASARPAPARASSDPRGTGVVAPAWAMPAELAPPGLAPAPARRRRRSASSSRAASSSTTSSRPSAGTPSRTPRSRTRWRPRWSRRPPAWCGSPTPAGSRPRGCCG